MARRDEGAYLQYVTEEQRSQPGLIIHHISAARPASLGFGEAFARTGAERTSST